MQRCCSFFNPPGGSTGRKVQRTRPLPIKWRTETSCDQRSAATGSSSVRNVEECFFKRVRRKFSSVARRQETRFTSYVFMSFTSVHAFILQANLFSAACLLACSLSSRKEKKRKKRQKSAGAESDFLRARGFPRSSHRCVLLSFIFIFAHLQRHRIPLLFEIKIGEEEKKLTLFLFLNELLRE